jgi:hypothetical protein
METILAYLDKKYPNISVLTKQQVQKELLIKNIPKKLDRRYVPKQEIAAYIKDIIEEKVPLPDT